MDDLENRGETDKKSRLTLILILLIVVLALVEAAGIFWYMSRRAQRADSKNITTIDENTKEDEEKSEGEVSDAKVSDEEVVFEVSGENIIPEKYQNGEVFVTIAQESMPLRQSPGFGEDVLEELPAGKYLRFIGETVEENGHVFRKVAVEESGQVGYVAAEYCTPVDFRYDPAVLNIVDTQTALYTYEQMVEDIETLKQTYPDLLEVSTIGQSLDGRDIYCIVLGNPNAPHRIFTQASIHGREYMNTQLVMKMIEYYAANYDIGTYHGQTYRDLFDQVAICIVPMVNPDGVTISQLGTQALNYDCYKELVYQCYLTDRNFLVAEQDSNGDWTWSDHYKEEGFVYDTSLYGEQISFEEYQRNWKANAGGVDLNNNFPAKWEEIDLKPDPSYGSFKGYFDMSEPETYALMQKATERAYDCYISYHSKGQLIYYNVEGNRPETSEKSLTLAMALQDVLQYKPVDTQKGYNVNLGGFSDWIQLEYDGMSVTIESGKHPCPLAADEFPGVWNRHRETWAMLCEKLSD